LAGMFFKQIRINWRSWFRLDVHTFKMVAMTSFHAGKSCHLVVNTKRLSHAYATKYTSYRSGIGVCCCIYLYLSD